jgi:hypothetical protein
MFKQEVVFVCPRGRRNRRVMTTRGTTTIRCSCGCGYVYRVTIR